MRVPNAGQQLDERRIVREGKRLAEALMANYVEAPSFTLPGLVLWMASLRQHVQGALRNLSVRY